MIKRLAIANRGEVAVRIIRACEDLGIESILLHSEADIGSRAYRMATHKECIGPAVSSQSYLDIGKNIQGAIAKGADALHPGFGFLSENPDFAEACAESGITFVGPRPEVIRTLGDKVSSKELAKKANVPLVPGYQGEDQNVQTLMDEAKKIGFPVIVKAAAGGGGRGMKILRGEKGDLELIESAQREAKAAFGSSKVFLEKYLENAKHIEVQIFGEASGRVVHLFERECSVQRRHQKIIEEAPSGSLPSDLREKICQAARRLAEEAGYTNAGTVEFLLHGADFYFLEVNTRLQVEHPVTEMVMGIDLVHAQILTAMGRDAFGSMDIESIRPRGHAIECRIYAENPYLGGVPSTGRLGTVQWPEGYGRRFEYGFESGDSITSHYDPMIAKVITWAENRKACITKMKRVLADSIIFGVHTNIPYLQEILSHPEFIESTMTTGFIEKYFSEPLKPLELSEADRAFVTHASSKASPMAGADQSKTMLNPWNRAWSNI